MIGKLDKRNLGINPNGMIHIDNTTRIDIHTDFKTWCGLKFSPVIYPLVKINEPPVIKLCKKCSKTYFNKYEEPFVAYISVLKLKNKLFTQEDLIMDG